MKNIVKELLNQIKEDKRKRRKSFAVMLVLSMLVASGVLWQIKITGITMTGEALCGQQAHLHTEQCLGMQTVCGLKESEGHKHTDACKTSEKVTICQKEEHTHAEGICYVQDVSECEKEEHQHTDACYEIRTSLTCGQEESEGHRHVAECKREAYVCGYEKEHEHTLLCYSDANADLETSADWEQTIPVLTQEPAEDLAAVARSQIGYTESQQNYKVAEDGSTKQGYTRYGEWYGNPYGNWSAMFASFCLHYAEHPAYEALKNSGVETMRLAAEDAGVYYAASAAAPGVGDLAFLDKDGNGNCETVAVVIDCQDGIVTLVEGDCGGIVAENDYSADNVAIMGYAVLTPRAVTADEPADDTIEETGESGAYNLTKSSEEAQADGNITISFVINDTNYTYDPGSTYTHLTVNSMDGLLTDAGLTYTSWASRYKITGTGTLVSYSIASGSCLSDSGYDLPALNVESIGNTNTYSYASARSWVTDSGMICNEKTVFKADTTLNLSLYETGTTCGLNWICNCDSNDDGTPDGAHSITLLVSGFDSPTFTWGQSVSDPYIPTKEAVDSKYTGSQYCKAGPDHGMQFAGWFVQDSSGKEIDFTAGMPILENYKDSNSSGYTVKVYARWEEAETPAEVTATFVNGETTVETRDLAAGAALGTLPTVTVPDGQIFLGWKIGTTTQYADAETEITENTTYTAVFADKVTVTFVNGETTVETRELAAGAALGTLPADPAADGQTFLGWKAEGADSYATAETVITADTTYTAVFTQNVTATFMHNNTEFAVVADIPVNAKLWDYLPENAPDGYADTDGVEWVFAGWKLADGTMVTEDTVVPVGLTDNALTLTAAFEEQVCWNVYFHDIDPDGNSYGAEGETLDLLIPDGESVADYLDGLGLLHDDADPADCIWKYKVGDEQTLTAYDLTAPVTSELHLYTYTYRVTLTRTVEETASLNLLDLLAVQASAVEVTVSDDGNTLTMVLREGEKPTAADFIKGDVDYSVYDWSFTDEDGNAMDITLAAIMENGVSETIKGTAAANDPIITDTATAKVRFQVIVNERLMDLGEQDVTVYKLKGCNSYSISQDTFLEVYKDFGFTVEDWVQNVYSLPQKIGDTGYWADLPLRVANGVYYNPSVGDPATASEVLYLPENSAVIEGLVWDTYKKTQSFYTVTISDPEHVAYPSESDIPAVQYVFRGDTATVTVPTVDDTPWTYTPQGTAEDPFYGSVSVTDNGNGTATYTFTNVTGPIILEIVQVSYTVSVADPDGLVYQTETNIPAEQQVLAGKTATVTVAAAAGNVDWTYTAQGSGENQVYESVTKTDNGDHTVTYTFTNVTGDIKLIPSYNGVTVSEKKINFYVFIDEKPVKIAEDTYPVYTASGYGKHYLSAAQLQEIYGAYGFTAAQLDSTDKHYFPHTNVNNGNVFTDAANAQLTAGIWFSPILNTTDNRDCDVYYVPGYTDGNTTLDTLKNTHSFYSVTVSDPAKLIYSDAADIPAVKYVFNGQSTTVTLPQPAANSGAYWQLNGEVLKTDSANGITVVDNSDGTVTCTIASVTEPMLFKSNREGIYELIYDVNLTVTPNSTAPTVNGLSQYTSIFDAQNESTYNVLIPDRLQFTAEATASLTTHVFDGWIVNGDTSVILAADTKLTKEQILGYAQNNKVTLTAQWTELNQNTSVSFYVNLACDVIDYSGSSGTGIQTGNNNYTAPLYGTSLTVTPPPSSYPATGPANTNWVGEGGRVVLGGTDTADTDKEIRKLANQQPYPAKFGVTGDYVDRTFTLGTFPNDAQMLNQIRAIQTGYIADYEKWWENRSDVNRDGKIDAGDYRAADPNTNKIIAINGVVIPVEDITAAYYTIRWVAFKYEDNGWHIDGTLVKKQGIMTITKTFYGETEAIRAVTGADDSYAANYNNYYHIDVMGIKEANGYREPLYTLTLNAAENQADDKNTHQTELGYKHYDAATNTYSWVITLTADWEAYLYERNYVYSRTVNGTTVTTLSDGVTEIATLAEYTATGFARNSMNTNGRVTYDGAGDGVEVAAKAHSIDDDFRTFETVAFNNSYLPKNAVPISKVDDYGNPLTGVTFQLYKNGAVMPVWKVDGSDVYYIYDPSTDNNVARKDANGHITVDKHGYALVMGLKDPLYAGAFQFKLVESITPEGYATIAPINFAVDSATGAITLTGDTNTAVTLPGGNTMRITNTSKTMDVTVQKEWKDGTNKEVTVELMLGNQAVSDKSPLTLNAANGWTGTWTDIPVYVGGELAEYTVRETSIGGIYYSKDADSSDGYADYLVSVVPLERRESVNGIPTAGYIKVENWSVLGGVQFRKLNENRRALSGATFQLYKTYADGKLSDPYHDAVTSGEDGVVDFGQLMPGEYYMEETDPPEGYNLDTTVYKITVAGGNATIMNMSTNEAVSEIVNLPSPAALKVKKVSGTLDGPALTGAKFQLSKKVNGSWTVQKFGNTLTPSVDENGELTLGHLMPGEYKLVEVQAPAGYYRLTEEICFKVEAGKIIFTKTSGTNWKFVADADNNTVTVVNVTGSELPHTGGMGTHFGTMAGLLMMASSLLYGFLLRRKRERGAV